MSELRALGEACKAALEWAEACCQVLEPEEGEEHATGTDAIKALIGTKPTQKRGIGIAEEGGGRKRPFTFPGSQASHTPKSSRPLVPLPFPLLCPLLSGSENSGKYMVATQDADLRGYLRGVASVGLLFVARAVLLMEPPSTSSKNTGNKVGYRHTTGERGGGRGDASFRAIRTYRSICMCM